MSHMPLDPTSILASEPEAEQRLEAWCLEEGLKNPTISYISRAGNQWLYTINEDRPDQVFDVAVDVTGEVKRR